MTKEEARFTYYFITQLEAKGNLSPKQQQKLIDLKREVRAWSKKRPPLNVVVDYGIDGCITLDNAPDWCETEQDVVDWFEENEWIHARPSMYDCTGQLFTSWYKPVFRRGKWMVYHRISVDV